MKLSIVIPVYNEVDTVSCLLGKVNHALEKINKEIIIVDDGSNDGTRNLLAQEYCEPLLYDNVQNLEGAKTFNKEENLKIIFHKQNKGKGAALRTGFKFATGDVIVIQDADLEYDPQDLLKMWKLIQEGYADVVYGSRFYGNSHRVLYFHHLLGNKVITAFIDLFCNTTLSDIEVCYKMFRKEVLEEMTLICNDFGFEVEFTVKVTKSQQRWRIYETGIYYYGRTYEEGKKINWKDGVKALWYIVKFALFN